MMRWTSLIVLFSSVVLCWPIQAQPAGASVPTGSFGALAFPGAEWLPEVAKAVEAYYRPGVSERQALSAAVLTTPAEFGVVCDFYGPKMDSGKWGWRRKTYPLLHQVQTLKFMRSEVAGRRGERDTAIPAVLLPLFGDLTWSQDRFNTELDELVATYKDTKIDIAEGTLARSTVLSDGQVRVTVERPYIDLGVMSLVQRTRIILVKVTDRAPHASPSVEPVWR